MGIGSFLAGLYLGGGSSTTVHNHKTVVVCNTIQYPGDWDEYSDEKKLEWLKNRSYWHEYYNLLSSQRKYFEVKIIDDEDDNIYYKVIDSIVKNKGDKTEAEQLFTEYLNKRYMFKVLNATTRMEIKMELDRMNEYIQNNYSAISQFYRPVEDYYFKVEIR